jgi:hypothetical protein
MTYNLKFKPNKKRGVKTQNTGNVKNARQIFYSGKNKNLHFLLKKL